MLIQLYIDRIQHNTRKHTSLYPASDYILRLKEWNDRGSKCRHNNL